MTQYKVTADHPVDTDEGRLVPPGGTFSSSTPSRRLDDLVDAGLLETTGGKPAKNPDDSSAPTPREETP